MDIQTIAKQINDVAVPAIYKSPYPNLAFRVALIGQSKDTMTYIVNQLRKLVAAAVEFDVHTPKGLTSKGIRGKARLMVIVFDPFKLEGEPLLSMKNSLMTAAQAAGVPVDSLMLMVFV